MSVFYIADTHFGHANCIKHDNRPFENIDQMENVMVRNWNAVVRPKDHVYILGDFACKNTDEWVRILKRLHGKKVLIRGNHDPKELPQEVINLLQGVYDYYVVHDNGRKVILSHYPILLYWHSHREDTYMLCGHVHQSKENTYLQKWKRELQREASDETQSHMNNRGQIYNAGCMMPYMDYTPRQLDEIIKEEKGYLARHPERRLLSADEICWNVERNTQLFVVQKDDSGNWKEGKWLFFTAVFSFMDVNYAEFIEVPTGLDLEDYGKTWEAYL